MNLLVVEDDVDAADALSEILTEAGWNVSVANDASRAITIAKVTAPDVALIDMSLPDGDGVELAQVLRRLVGEDLRLIAITGDSTASARARTFESGFQMHLTKPLKREQVLRSVSSGMLWEK